MKQLHEEVTRGYCFACVAVIKRNGLSIIYGTILFFEEGGDFSVARILLENCGT